MDLLLGKANHYIVTNSSNLLDYQGSTSACPSSSNFSNFSWHGSGPPRIWSAVMKESGSGPWSMDSCCALLFELYIIEDMFDKTNRRNLGLVKIGRTYTN